MMPGGAGHAAWEAMLAGKLLIVASVAKFVVVGEARRQGIIIDWRRHARTGPAVTMVTLAIAVGWLSWRAP